MRPGCVCQAWGEWMCRVTSDRERGEEQFLGSWHGQLERGGCLRGSIAVMKPHVQKQVGEERTYFIYTCR